MSGDLQIRLMREADIPFAMDLKNLARWNQTDRDWRNYLSFEPDGCFVAEVSGVPAGTATTITYPHPHQVGWIGMVLVHPDRRRQGIGSGLLHHSIDYLRGRGMASIKLDATPVGMKVYVPLNFAAEHELYRMEGIARSQTKVPFLRVTPSDLRSLVAFDTEAFGVNRGRVLTQLLADSPGLSYVEKDEQGKVNGYLLARSGYEAYQIGPWVAASPHIAQRLFRQALRDLCGERVFLDVPLSNSLTLEIVQGLGFIKQREFVRMFLGVNPFPGMAEWIYASSSAEKG